MPGRRPRVMLAASERSADLLYASGFRAPDAFLYLEKDGRKHLLLSDLEIDRGKREAIGCRVHSQSQEAKRLSKGSDESPSVSQVIIGFLKRLKVRSADVPGDFPLGVANAFAKAGIRLYPMEGLFCPEREFKSADELRKLGAATKITEAGMARAIEVLKGARIGKARRLVWGGKTLTSERLRNEADTTMLQAGGLPENSIVAGGEQACDPHERGTGPLRAHELIIIDLFPRDQKTGYFGDLTRTVIRGKASEAQRALWETCLAGQKRALESIAPGVGGKQVQDEVRQFFTRAGYPTKRIKGRWTGFFHGLGHGLGLDLHEHPRIAATTFRPGQVFTVEPGIYLPGVGGVRHEDVVTVTEKGIRLLSRLPKPMEV